MILYPAGKTHLTIDSKLITRDMKKTVRTAWNLIDLQKDYATQFGWNRAAFNKFDWKAGG
eukprot:13751041-Ditylum_brightwellii.AAC.1